MLQNTRGGGIDLPQDLREELADFASRSRGRSHYEVLGVGPDSDAASIRRAYLERSRRYHPDAWYGKNLGEYAPLLSKAFQRLSTAYQVLSDADLRAQYDKKTAAKLSAVERAASERRQLSREEEERREREGRERLLRSKGFARIAAARKLYQDSLALAETGERARAIATLQAARELDPRRPEIAQTLIELEQEAQKARSRFALQNGHEHEDKGEMQAAMTAYAQAFQIDPHSYEGAIGAARCAFAAGEVQKASSFAAKATDVAPRGDPEARLLLGKAFIELGFKAKARHELTLILSEHPEHKEARVLLKRV
ncbi:MAG: DnaJ domain-containing protein [Myxococcales bacterium]